MVFYQGALHFGLVANHNQYKDAHPVGDQPQQGRHGQQRQHSTLAIAVEQTYEIAQRQSHHKVAQPRAAVGNEDVAVGDKDAVAFNNGRHFYPTDHLAHHFAAQVEQGWIQVIPDRYGKQRQQQ